MKIIILSLNLIIFLAKAQNIYTYAGNGSGGFSGDGGTAVSASLKNPFSTAIDAIGNIYFTDYNNHRIRKINTSGIITTIAGIGVPNWSGDGGPAISALLNSPSGITIDASGNIYFSDTGNHRVRKISASGTITTVAGNGVFGFSGDGGPAISAQINTPIGVSVDASGNIYIADLNNHRIRMVNTSGIISTIAGTGSAGFSGDGGPAISTQVNNPIGVFVDGLNNILIADRNNSRIRKIDNLGIITTIAGNGSSGFSGDGGLATSAQLSAPSGVGSDASGNIYITDLNNTIRVINTSSVISTITGIAIPGYSGDGGPASLAKINLAYNLSVDPLGNYYFADSQNNRIRIICSTNCPLGTNLNLQTNGNDGIHVNPNPVSNILHILSKQNEFSNSEIEIINYLGQVVLETKFNQELDVSSLINGIYVLRLKNSQNQLAVKRIAISR